MSDVCSNILTYKKSDPSEIIDIGDLIMINPDNGLVKKASFSDCEDYVTNSRLIIGVCVGTNNTNPTNITIDGGNSNTVDTKKLDGGTSIKPTTIIIDGGTSTQNGREIIQLAYDGKQIVNICGYVNLGDSLCLGRVPGKAESFDYLTNIFYVTNIGQVIQYTDNKDQVKVLLDI